MPTIRATRDEVSDRFPVLGFTVHTNGNPCFEVMLTTDPDLPKEKRTVQNFYSTRLTGPLVAERGEAVFLAPTDVVQRFREGGAEKLFYGLATFSDSTRSRVEFLRVPSGQSPYVNLRSYSGRGSRRMQMGGTVRGGRRNGNGNGGSGYAGSAADELIWAGDQARPGMEAIAPANAPATAAPKNGSPPGASAAPSNGQSPPAQSAALKYDDGFGEMPEVPANAISSTEPGIEGPIPDAPAAAASAYRYAKAQSQSPEYPQASRFVPAHTGNYRGSSSPRTINRIVIHITDGGPNINGPISWFQNPSARVSAHYIVGQDGEVVQMVLSQDVAWHASSANGASIGIEHVANTKGLVPTEAEYCASAALVSWLCDQFGIPKDRQHILGHAEADPHTSHTACPNGTPSSPVWDWNYFMGMVTKGACEMPPTSEAHGYARPLAIVEPAYQPKDPAEALSFMKEWLERKERWRSGVPDTSFFPHSAICHLSLKWDDDETYVGTGFYISPNRILTCAHNVVDIAAGHHATSITITPGKNGAGTPPFGSFTVMPGAWQYHPQYDDTRDFDLAVIKVGTAPPNGLYFAILEELLECRDSSIIVCGYSGKPVDSNKQHLDGDQVRELSDNDQRLEYNLQTQPGASGSPVFYVWGYEDEEKQQSVMETRIIGVHVAGRDATLNEACRLTQDKITWIWSAGATLGAGTQSLGSAPLAGRTVRIRGAGKSIVRPATLGLGRRRTGWSFGAADPEAQAGPMGSEVADLVRQLRTDGVSDAEISAFLDELTPCDSSSISTEAGLAVGVPVRVFGQDGAEVTLPGGTTLGGWKARLLLTAVGAAFGPYGIALFNSLPTASNQLNVTIGIGYAASGGIIHGAGLGVGIVFAPGSVIGFYGSLSGAMGWLRGISATVQIIVVRGGISNFTGVCTAITIAGGEGVVGAASALFKPSGEFLGITAEVGIGAGWPIGFYEQAQKTYGTPQSLSRAAGGPREHSVSASHLAPPPAALRRAMPSAKPTVVASARRNIRPGPARGLGDPGEITPDYSQAHSISDAIAMFRDWLDRQLKFRTGVHDTSFFPHSAIAKLRLLDGSGALLGEGSGFYVGRNKLITAGHCLINDDGSRVQGVEVIPGLHGTSEPFVSGVVGLSGLKPHSSYTPLARDPSFDIGVIVGAPDAPNDQFFAMEELRMSPNTGVITCGYAAVGVDPTIQHMDIDTIREVHNGTFTYAAQVRQGSSGGPVFYALDATTIRVVGLNVTAYGDHQNRGLRLTDPMISWINSL